MRFNYRFRYQKEIVVVMIVVVAVLALHYTFTPTNCADFSCFQAHMVRCESAIYVNEESEASWRYRVIGTADKKCDIEVTLLNAKEGNIALRQYEKTSMTCSYALGVGGYPEKNLVACHGELKEGLQTVVIEKLYKYIVANLGEIREEILY